VGLLEGVAVALAAAEGGCVPDCDAVGVTVRVGDGVTAEEGGREALALDVAAGERDALPEAEADPEPVADVDADALAVAGGVPLHDAVPLADADTLAEADTVAVTLDEAPALLLLLAELVALGDALSDELADEEPDSEPAIERGGGVATRGGRQQGDANTRPERARVGAARIDLF